MRNARHVVACVVIATGLLAPAQGSAQVTVPAVVREIPSASVSFNSTVWAVAHRGDVIYVGGAFTQVTDRGQTYRRRGLAAVSARTGHLLRWRPSVRGTVHALAAVRDGVYVGGSFSRVDGEPRRNLAKVRGGGRGAVVEDFDRRVKGTVRAIVTTRKAIYVGGQITAAGRRTRHGLAAFDRSAPYRLRRWAPQATGGDVLALARVPKAVVVVGNFKALDGHAEHQRLAMVTARKGALVTWFRPKVHRPVFDIAVTPSSVYAAQGGVGGRVSAFARSDGRESWHHTYDGDAQAVAVLGETLYVGGHYSNLCTTDHVSKTNGDCLTGRITRRRLSSLTTSGELLDWAPDANAYPGVLAMDAVPTSDLLVTAGNFTTMAGGPVPAGRFAIFRGS